MRSSLLAGAALVATASAQAGCNQESGNFYCELVQKIFYTGFGTSNTYQKVTSMENGQCQQEPYSYSGTLAPFDEGLSMHLRGPAILYQFAAYVPQSGSSKAKRDAPERRNAHAHAHEQYHKRNQEIRAAAEAKRAVGDLVTATIDGQVVHWINTYAGPGGDNDAPPAESPAASSAAAPKIAAVAESSSPSSPKPSKAASKPASSSSADDSKVPAGDWKRIAYYSGEGGSSDGLVVLNAHGGDKSGVFDTTFGMSLSYASSDATAGAASPQQFNGNLTSDQEVAIFTDTKCTTSTCDPWRPGTVAYEGWAGVNKAFFIEIEFPYDGNTGFNGDMPSYWFLNGAIPRTQQYGGCSCWKSGCGEIDICEVLDSGNSKCKSTVHGNPSGGSSNYFDRPTVPTKFSVVFANNQVHIQQLDDSFDFSTGLTSSQIDSLTTSQQTSSGNFISSLFALIPGLG